MASLRLLRGPHAPRQSDRAFFLQSAQPDAKLAGRGEKHFQQMGLGFAIRVRAAGGIERRGRAMWTQRGFSIVAVFRARKDARAFGLLSAPGWMPLAGPPAA